MNYLSTLCAIHSALFPQYPNYDSMLRRPPFLRVKPRGPQAASFSPLRAIFPPAVPSGDALCTNSAANDLYRYLGMQEPPCPYTGLRSPLARKRQPAICSLPVTLTSQGDFTKMSWQGQSEILLSAPCGLYDSHLRQECPFLGGQWPPRCLLSYGHILRPPPLLALKSICPAGQE